MKTRRRKLEELLWVLGLHAPARRLFSATMGRSAAEARAKMTDFYRSIVQPGTLVFDIGANAGTFSAVFASLGARVVALEPNADCVRHIQVAYAGQAIETLQAAVGQTNGVIEFNVADESDGKSSVSQEWMAAAKEQDESSRGVWTRKIPVPLVTLDALIVHFGMPSYIKIDVEGYEEAVLAGLSNQPRMLSFEFHAMFLEAAMRCLETGLFEGGSRFNYVRNSGWGYPACFELAEWVDKSSFREVLAGMRDKSVQGDVFVKAPQAES